MPYRYIARKAKDFFLYRVLHVDDTPHRIALGVALGMFTGWLPIVGIQMMVTLVLATIFRANKIVGLPWVWISNPVTMPVMYAIDYWAGRLVMLQPLDNPIGLFEKALSVRGGVWTVVTAWLKATWDLAVPLMLGGFVVALIWGVPTYFVIRWAVVTYRRRRHERLERKQESPGAPGAA